MWITYSEDFRTIYLVEYSYEEALPTLLRADELYSNMFIMFITIPRFIFFFIQKIIQVPPIFKYPD
jgi:hypothetical protein